MGDESCDALAAGEDYYNKEADYFRNIPAYTKKTGVELALYEKYYGKDFLNNWVDAAFQDKKSDLKNFNQDYTKQAFERKLKDKEDPSLGFKDGECVGREEAVKKSIAYTGTYIQMNQYFEEAKEEVENGCVWATSDNLYVCDTPGEGDSVDVNTCKRNFNECKDAVNAWEKAIATWSGSLEDEYGLNLKAGGEYGKSLFALAGKRCDDFGTCGTRSKDDKYAKDVLANANYKIAGLLGSGRNAIYSGDAKLASFIVAEINAQLTVILIQGTLRYAYRLGEKGSKFDKEVAEGAAFAFGAIPQVDACYKASSKILSEELAIGGKPTAGTVNFDKILSAFECSYDCLGISFDDVGELAECDGEGEDKGTTLCFTKKSRNSNICKKEDKKFKKSCKKFRKKPNKSFINTRYGKIVTQISQGDD
jgi:hypothetical protein